MVLFFCLNTAIALYTAVIADLQMWALYNGLISYLAVGTLFGVEFLIRQIIRKRHQPPTTKLKF